MENIVGSPEVMERGAVEIVEENNCGTATTCIGPTGRGEL